MGEICGVRGVSELVKGWTEILKVAGGNVNRPETLVQLTEGTERALRRLFTEPPPKDSFVRGESPFNIEHGYLWGKIG